MIVQLRIIRKYGQEMTKPKTEELKDLLYKVTQGEWRKVSMGGYSTVLTSSMPPRNDQRANCTYGFRGEEFCVAYPFIEDDGKSFRPDFVCFGHDDATLIALAPTLAAEVVRLREALGFYAEFHRDPNAGPWGMNSNDFGNIARQALSQK